MLITIDDAQLLVEGAMSSVGFSADEARIIADQIIDCELRGVAIGGLSRALSIVARTQGGPSPSGPIRTVRETPVSALVEGGDNCGYLVAHRATQIAIEKAKMSGLAAVGAFDTWYTGMFAHYMEMATEAGLVALCAGSSAPRVAPAGSSQGRFGTNPIAFGFPTKSDPVILDIGTSKIMVADCVLNARLGLPLEEDTAYDASGRPTMDPIAAMQGAFQVWGGHKGSGLATVIQLLGIMVGGGLLPQDNRECAFFVICLRPDLFMDEVEMRHRFSAYAAAVRTARPERPDANVRLPFERSAEHRRKLRHRGAFDVPDAIVSEFKALMMARGRT